MARFIAESTMSHAQPSMQAEAAVPAFADMPLADADYALGCECADPRLTIEMWDADAGSLSPSAAEPHH
jgi:hypothetical protein